MVYFCSNIHYTVNGRCAVKYFKHHTNGTDRQTVIWDQVLKVYTIDLLLTGNNDGRLGSFRVLVPCHIQSKQKLGVL